MKKILLIISFLFLASIGIASAAPVSSLYRSLIPETTDTYYIGTTTPSSLEWNGIFAKNLTISGTCTGCGGSSFPFTPQSWGNSTSTTIQFTQGIISNASSTFSYLGNGSVGINDGRLYNAATTTFSTGLTYAGGAVTCNTASGSIFGCLSSADWTTFNNKLSSYDAWTHPSAGVSATSSGIIISASSTIGSGTQANGLTISGGATTTGFLVVQDTGTSTFSGPIDMGLSNHITTHGVRADASDGLHIHANNWTQIALLGAANTANSTFYGAVNIDGATRLATSLTGVATLSSGSVAAASATTCTNQFVRAMSASYIATCAAVSLTSDVTGTLPIANGGTNATSFTTSGNGVYYNGTSLLTAPLTSAVAYPFASSTAVSATTLCISTDCKTAWPAGLTSYDAWTHPAAGQSATTSLMVFNGGASSTAITSTNGSWFGTALNTFVGVGTTSPFAKFSIHAQNGDTNKYIFAVASSTASATTTLFSIDRNGSITLDASSPATSTTMVLDWANTPPMIEYKIGTSATTITLINATTSQYWGSRKMLVICNPGGSAGAITFAGVEWAGGTTPTQTTTANQCDTYSFFVTSATSTLASPTYKVFGAASTGFQ